ncbi:MAG: cobalamin biosynthesis protein CobW [Rhodobacterales bacterium]|nr:cobalamin biosynthesis protein CobW [Rhodobacterales bacterium]
MSDYEKLPVTVITGFLGSGKTTLIRHLIQNPGGKRLAVVVNEFGDVGVDGDILKSCAIPECPAENIMELANGCICCTVADDFIPTIEALIKLDPQPQHIIIETSGLALPKPLLKAFDWPEIRSKITVDGVVALADAEAVASGRFAPDVAAVDAQREADDSINHETPLSEVFDDQMSCADLVLLTKCDLTAENEIEKAKNFIRSRSSRSLPVIDVVEGNIDPRVVLGLEAAAEDDIDARPSHHDSPHDHDHEDYDSIVVDLPEYVKPEDLVERIERLATRQNILRVKGFAAVRGKPMRLLVQAVGARVRWQYDRAWVANEDKRGRLVVIAEHDDIVRSSVEAELME